MENERISFEEVDDATLDINLSVLAERNGTVRDTAIMDHYGIRVFDWKIEEQIRQYEANEQQKIAYYKKRVLSRDRNQEDKELETIRKQVFAVSSVPSKMIEDYSNQRGVWQSAVLTTIIMALEPCKNNMQYFWIWCIMEPSEKRWCDKWKNTLNQCCRY